ncbi:MAG: nucleotidyl transferase AbiEii/AbiGii toxin family protein [Anaerolineales bacterium]
MIEKRLVQWYAHDAGVDLDIAEREIVLTYVLRLLHDSGLLDNLAFKGGTAIRKVIMGRSGRFSLDLDFSVHGGVTPHNLVEELQHLLHEETYHGLNFLIPEGDAYVTDDSSGCGAEVTYSHAWIDSSYFGIQISFRAPPLLPVKNVSLIQERYFEWMEVDPPQVPTLDELEILGEKIRAAIQRSRVRDLYDLFQLGKRPFNRELVRRIAVIKCWEARHTFNPDAFLSGLPEGQYDWSDLERLVRPEWLVSAEDIITGVQNNYAFLREMTDEETQLSTDPYGRHHKLHDELVGDLREQHHLSE